jgi:hypothetical protein
VVNEEQIFTFSFWLNGSVRSGMSHEGELYCRLASFSIQKRPRVYQLGCKLTQQQTAIVLSSSAATCSLWGSLRDPSMKRILLTADTSKLLETMLLPQTKAYSGDQD